VLLKEGNEKYEETKANFEYTYISNGLEN